MTPGIGMFLTLVGAHLVADYPLQGDYLATAKNRFKGGVPGTPWRQALFAHAGIHGLFVGLVTGLWWLGLVEVALHAWIDDRKCAGWFTFDEDQALHVLCKVVYVVILYVVMVDTQPLGVG